MHAYVYVRCASPDINHATTKKCKGAPSSRTQVFQWHQRCS